MGNTNTEMTIEEDQAEALRVVATDSFFVLFGAQISTPAIDIKKKYRLLALKFHPDRNKAPAASDAFKHVAEGFRTLNDMSKRVAHLQALHQKSKPKKKQQAPRPQPARQPKASNVHSPHLVRQTCSHCKALFGMPEEQHVCCPCCMFYRFNSCTQLIQVHGPNGLVAHYCGGLVRIFGGRPQSQ